MNKRPDRRLCTNCQYYRQRAAVILFPPSQGGRPGIIKTRIEYEEMLRQRAESERQKAYNREIFDYEPYHYAWCAAYTYLSDEDLHTAADLLQGKPEVAQQFVVERVSRNMELVRAAREGNDGALMQHVQTHRTVQHPVTGEILLLYELCDWCNPTMDCVLYDGRMK
jgi:hypothetical protein